MFNHSLREVWGLLNSPIMQLLKPIPKHEYIDLSPRGNGYWEADELSPKEMAKLFDEEPKMEDIERKAFPMSPANFKPANGQAVATMDSVTATSSAYSLASSQASPVQLEWYSNQGFIGYQSCAVIAQHWLVDRACKLPGKDAIRNGYSITSNSGGKLDPKVVQDIRDLDEQFDINENMKQFSKFRRVFGIRIALFVIKSKDKKYYEKPFNIDGVTEGSYQGIVQVDPYWITPELDGDAAGNPGSMYFYEPTYWRINGNLYHRSHLIISRFAEVPDVLKPNYIYGGIPLPQMIYERVYAAERSANEAPEVLLTKRLYVIKTNTVAALNKFGAFLQRMNVFSSLKNNQGIQVIDKNEELEQKDTNLTHVKETIEGQYDLVSGPSEVPITKLLLRQITGLNSQGDGDRRNYTDVLEDEQSVLSKLLNRHHLLLMKSHVEPKRGEQPRICSIWNEVNTPSAKEAAEIRKSDSETAKNYYEMAVVDSEEIRNKLIADEKSGYAVAEDNDQDDMDYSEYTLEEKNRKFPNSPIQTI